MPHTWHVWRLRQSHMQRSSKRSRRINKVHRIWDLWWRPIDQLDADCLRHSEVPMGIIAKSELRQNYCITEDKLRHFTLTITVAPFQRLMSVDKDKVSLIQLCLLVGSHCVLSPRVKNCWLSKIGVNAVTQSWNLKASITHQSWKEKGCLSLVILNIKHACQICNNRPMLRNLHFLSQPFHSYSRTHLPMSESRPEWDRQR